MALRNGSIDCSDRSCKLEIYIASPLSLLLRRKRQFHDGIGGHLRKQRIGRNLEQLLGARAQIELVRKAPQLRVKRAPQENHGILQPELRKIDDGELQNAVH